MPNKYNNYLALYSNNMFVSGLLFGIGTYSPLFMLFDHKKCAVRTGLVSGGLAVLCLGLSAYFYTTQDHCRRLCEEMNKKKNNI